MKRFLITFLSAISIMSGGLCILQPAHGFAQSSNPLDNTCAQSDAKLTDFCKDRPSATTNPATSAISKVINVLLIAAGVASVIMIMVGGFQYVMSGGESSRINSAKNTILYAVIGLVISLLATVIVKFVVKRI